MATTRSRNFYRNNGSLQNNNIKFESTKLTSGKEQPCEIYQLNNVILDKTYNIAIKIVDVSQKLVKEKTSAIKTNILFRGTN